MVSLHCFGTVYGTLSLALSIFSIIWDINSFHLPFVHFYWAQGNRCQDVDAEAQRVSLVTGTKAITRINRPSPFHKAYRYLLSTLKSLKLTLHKLSIFCVPLETF